VSEVKSTQGQAPLSFCLSLPADRQGLFYFRLLNCSTKLSFYDNLVAPTGFEPVFNG